MWKVPKTKILFREDKELGPLVSCDNGETWMYTYRGLEEFREMHPTLEPVGQLEGTAPEFDGEVWGETLDEPLPDDLIEYIESI